MARLPVLMLLETKRVLPSAMATMTPPGCSLVADQNMSVLDGSIGILPRRVLVLEEDIERARQILADAGIGDEIREG